MAEYCDFLNRVAATDPDHLYDEKMGTDFLEGSIIRTGTPGFFHYEVIEGKEMQPVSYINQIHQIRYCEESGTIAVPSLVDFELTPGNLMGEEAFSSNQSPFFVASQSNTVALSLGTSASGTQNSSLSTLEEIGGLALLAGAGYFFYKVIAADSACLNGEQEFPVEVSQQDIQSQQLSSEGRFVTPLNQEQGFPLDMSQEHFQEVINGANEEPLNKLEEQHRYVSSLRAIKKYTSVPLFELYDKYDVIYIKN